MSTADELKSLGNKAFAAGNHDEAIKFFTQAIDLDPTNHVLYSNRSASLASLKKYDEALKDAEKTIEIKPDWAKGYSRKGAALFGLRKLSDAHETYAEGLKIDPDNALLKKGVSDVESALKKQADDMGFGDIATKMSDAFKGDVIAKLAANPQTAPFLAQPDFVEKVKAIQSDPNMLEKHASDQRITMALFTLMGMGDMLNMAGRGGEPGAQGPGTSKMDVDSEGPKQEKAKVEEERAEEEPVEVSEEERADAAKRAEAAEAKALGNAAYKKRQFEEALGHYEKAITLDPSDITFFNNKAAVYFEMGKYDECIETAKKAVETGREHRSDYKHIAKALGRIGTACSKKGEYDEAIEYFNRSLTEHRTADILNKLRALEKEKKHNEELAYIDADKSNEARERGNAYFKEGKFAEAQKEYTEAIKRQPNDARNYSNRAACLTKLLAIPDAIKDCDKCIEIEPSFVKAYIRKANAQFLMRDYAEALDTLDVAKEKDGEEGENKGKHEHEIEQLVVKSYSAISEQNSRTTPEEALKRAQNNPKIAMLLNDPVMQSILQQMQSDPRAAREHLKNPAVASNLRKLMAAGIVRMG